VPFGSTSFSSERIMDGSTVMSRNTKDRDPGDAVPSGVAVQQPAPLTEEEQAVKRKLEELPSTVGRSPDPPGQPQGRAEPIGPEKRGA
jgi:hypothetical protein